MVQEGAPVLCSKPNAWMEMTTEQRALVKKLQRALKRQIDVHTQNTAVKVREQCSLRDSAVSTIRCLNLFYGFGTENFATAVSYIDRFLSRVKVHPKYYSCLASACFFLAAKFHQESEDIPSVDELVTLQRQTWKSSDLKRMELVVLEKLSWNLWTVTCPEIARICCDIITSFYPNQTAPKLPDILQKYEVCINYSCCAIYSPAALAVSLLHLSFREAAGPLSPAIVQCLLYLQSQTMVNDSEVHDCTCAVVGILDNYSNNPALHPSCLPLPKPAPRVNLVQKPSFYGDTDLPTIEEEINMERCCLEENSHFLYKPKRDTNRWTKCILPPINPSCSVD